MAFLSVPLTTGCFLLSSWSLLIQVHPAVTKPPKLFLQKHSAGGCSAQWGQLRAAFQADSEWLRSVISSFSSSFLYFRSCGQLTRLSPGLELRWLNRTWETPGQDMRNCWPWEIRTDMVREVTDKGWILQVVKEVWSEQKSQITAENPSGSRTLQG